MVALHGLSVYCRELLNGKWSPYTIKILRNLWIIKISLIIWTGTAVYLFDKFRFYLIEWGNWFRDVVRQRRRSSLKSGYDLKVKFPSKLFISDLQHWNYVKSFSMSKMRVKMRSHFLVMSLNCYSLINHYVSLLRLNNSTGRLIFVFVTKFTVEGITNFLPIPRILGSYLWPIDKLSSIYSLFRSISCKFYL